MSNTVTVSTLDALYEALGNAEGGETILLEGGEYGDFTLNAKSGFDLDFASTVTIKSADADNPAIFAEMALHKVENLTIDGVVFDYGFETGDLTRERPFEVNQSTNIQITNSTFEGDRVLDDHPDPDGFGTAFGLFVRDSSEVTIEDNVFYDWHRGLIVDNVDDVVVKGNEIYDVRSDAMNFVAVQGALIEGNHIHDIRGLYSSGDHRDMIQFWTNGAERPTTDVIIRDNQLDIGDGSFAHAIFMRNESVDSQGGGPEMFYQNILIEGNNIYGGHLHGITVGETNGLTIRENSVIAVSDDNNPDQSSSAVWIPVISVNTASQDVQITANVTAGINGHEGQPDWTVKGNAFIQNTNPFGIGYYDDVFVTSSMTLGPDGHGFVLKAGSIPDIMAAGAPALHEAPDISAQKALFNVAEAAQGANTKLFDASLTADILAEQGITDATYTWTFADGQTAQGVQVEQGFDKAGHHDVSLTVVLPDGTELAAESVVAIRGGQLLSFNADQGAFTAFGFGGETDLGSIAAVEGGALQLGGTGSVATVTHEAFDGLRGSDTVDLSFVLEGEGAGEVFRLHGSFITSVNKEGDLAVLLFNEDNDRIQLKTEGLKINDGAAHEISVSVQDGLATLRVDDQTFEPVDFPGTFANTGSWDLAFGNPWGKANFDGSLTQFDVSVGPDLENLVSGPAPVAEHAAQFRQATVSFQEEVFDDVATFDPAIFEEPTSYEICAVDKLSPGAAQASEPAQTAQLENYALLVDDATSIVLNGEGEFHNFGRLHEFETSETIGFSVDFTVAGENEADARLIWNHLKLGLTIQDDEILVQVATADEGFKGFRTEGLGLTADQEHNATVLVDSENDQLQLIFDGRVVLEVDDSDFALLGAGGREWGWSVGTAWNRPFEGEVSGLAISDEFVFAEGTAALAWTDDII